MEQRPKDMNYLLHAMAEAEYGQVTKLETNYLSYSNADALDQGGPYHKAIGVDHELDNVDVP